MENSQNPTPSGFGSFSMPNSGDNPFGSGGKKVFGTGTSSPFGVTTQSQNLFSLAAAPVFGSTSNSVKSISNSSVGGSFTSTTTSFQFSSQSLFSKTAPSVGDTQPGLFQSGGSTAITSDVFGNKFSSSSSPSTSTSLFGKSVYEATTTVSSSSNLQAGSLFGAKDSPSTQGLFKGAGNETSTFSIASNVTPSSASAFGSQLKSLPTSDQPPTLFGKSVVPSSVPQNTSSGGSTSLFGQPITCTQSIRPTSNISSSSSSFSQPVSNPSKSLTFSSGNQPIGLFGKPANLFSGNKGKVSQQSREENVADHKLDTEGTSPKKSIGKWKSTRKPSALPLARRRSLLASSSRSDVLSEDATPSNSLVVCHIPPSCIGKDILRRHFSQFGKIIFLRVTAEKASALVKFDSKDSAQKAKEATIIDDDNPPMEIFYRQSPQSLVKRTLGRISAANDSKRKEVSQDAENELKSLAEIPEFETESEITSTSTHSALPTRVHTHPPRRVRTPPTRQSSPAGRPRSSTPTPQSSISVPQDSAASQDVVTIKSLLKTLYQAKGIETIDRIAILDKRDHLLKLLRGRQQSDLASAKAFKGTCPDMCPEKERYYREDTRRLALYEVIPSTMSTVAGQKTKVDHAQAVKEYSRSSADQVEPLPHELRPLPVLRSTMVYLLKYVADEGGEGKWSEWYDFLWNRTRGIRKDITQQQLCHLEVAHLLEQCSRFHIFCSERLCEEDMMTFDAKINNENLTKCLQTLKELYSDLEMKHNCNCPNEAEMRGYIALMNLNQGDTLREIQQLRPEIRESFEIRFAIQAYNALNSCNYVRFFRLIRGTSFLNGCILHRYFNQIRSQALHIIKKAMGTPGKSTPYPITEMIRLLCFENASEVMKFCSYYGLRVDSSSVYLDGASFIEPEGSLPQCRSITLVENKRTVPVGEIIHGGPLPEFDVPEPHSSFGSDGQFIFSAEFQQKLVDEGLKIPSQIGEILSKGPVTYLPEAYIPEEIPKPTSPIVKQPEQPVYSNNAIEGAGRILILEETDGMLVGIAQEAIKDERLFQATVDKVSQEILDSAVFDNLKSVAISVIDKEEQELRHALEIASRKQKCIESLQNEIIDEVVDEFTNNIVTEVWDVAEKEYNLRLLEECAQANAESILNVAVKNQINHVAAEVYEMDVVAKLERLHDTEARILFERKRKCFQLWHQSYLKSLRVKRAMLDFPVAPPSRSQSEQLSALLPSRPTSRITGNAFFIGERAKLNVTSPMDTLYNNLYLSAKLSMASAQQMLSGLHMWQPLDIASTVSLQLISILQEWKDCDIVEKDTKYIQWKVVLSTPLPKGNAETDFVWWMRTKLGCNKSQNEGLDQKLETSAEGDIVSNYTTVLPSSSSYQISLSFCALSFHGNWKDTQAKKVATTNVLKGMSGLVFVTSDLDSFSSSEAFWKKDQLRLEDMLTKKSKFPAIPLIVIIPRLKLNKTVSSEMLNDHLQLDKLYKKGLVSAVHFAQPYVGSNQPVAVMGSEWMTQLSNCLRFLASHVPAPPILAVKSLEDFVEDGVVEMYKAPVYQDLRTRTRLQLLHQSPNTLLSLYNDIIDHLGMVVASDTLTKCSWPAPEFDHYSTGVKSNWNSEDHLCDVYELMTKLRLPFFHYSDMEENDWETACQDVWKYIEKVTKKDSGSAKICLYQKVTDLLHTTKKRFDQFCWLTISDYECEPTYVNMAWTDLIDACIHYKLVSLRTGHFYSQNQDQDQENVDDEDNFEEQIVYYNQSELEEYESPSTWKEALRDTETAASSHIKDTVAQNTARLKRNRSEISEAEEGNTIGKRIRHTAEVQKEQNDKLNETETGDQDLKCLNQSCAEMLAKEKETSERFEKLLASVLDDSNSTHLISEQSFNYSVDNRRGRQESLTDKTPNSKHNLSLRNNTNVKRCKLLDLMSGTKESENELDQTDKEIPEYDVERVEKLDTITEQFTNLKDEVEEQKRLDTLFEMKLRKWISEGDTLM